MSLAVCHSSLRFVLSSSFMQLDEIPNFDVIPRLILEAGRQDVFLFVYISSSLDDPHHV